MTNQNTTLNLIQTPVKSYEVFSYQAINKKLKKILIDKKIKKMSKPLEQITKEYSSRGPLKQYRFDKSISFSCFRCEQTKVSKLITIYGNNWTKRLCNGCYGRLLSIYNIKAGQQNIDEKVEQISILLLKLVAENKIKEQTNRIILKQNLTKHLSSLSIRFFATSECVAETLSKEQNLDWSPAIIGICKAFELEIIERFINPLKDLSKGLVFSDSDLKDKDFGRIASYCSGKPIKPPELGVLNHFLMTALNSKDRIETSSFLRDGFKPFILKRPNSNWLIDKKGFISSIDNLTKNYRNKAAHTDELDKSDYDNCKELVFGNNGIMWELIISTQTTK